MSEVFENPDGGNIMNRALQRKNNAEWELTRSLWEFYKAAKGVTVVRDAMVAYWDEPDYVDSLFERADAAIEEFNDSNEAFFEAIKEAKPVVKVTVRKEEE